MYSIIILVFSIFMLHPQSETAGRTVLDGVYTVEQAEIGEKVYDASCIRCHEGNDPDGPTLMGRTFVERWREDDLNSLFQYMSDRMPADAPGNLKSEEYVDLTAFLLRANAYPDGSRPLTVDALSGITIVGPDGPKPLPTNTLVQVIGCLTAGPADEWTLTQSTALVRSRQGKETSAEELKKSAVRPLGTHTFSLRNFDNIQFGFKPDPFKGHKVQVKGVLIRQSTGGERITVTALESIAPVCGERD